MRSFVSVANRLSSPEYVNYRYTVNGVDYTSNLITPNKWPKSHFRNQDDKRAYYNPKRHHIAVLNPKPYDAEYLVMLILFVGLIGGFLFYISIRYKHYIKN